VLACGMACCREPALHRWSSARASVPMACGRGTWLIVLGRCELPRMVHHLLQCEVVTRIVLNLEALVWHNVSVEGLVALVEAQLPDVLICMAKVVRAARRPLCGRCGTNRTAWLCMCPGARSAARRRRRRRSAFGSILRRPVAGACTRSPASLADSDRFGAVRAAQAVHRRRVLRRGHAPRSAQCGVPASSSIHGTMRLPVATPAAMKEVLDWAGTRGGVAHRRRGTRPCVIGIHRSPCRRRMSTRCACGRTPSAGAAGSAAIPCPPVAGGASGDERGPGPSGAWFPGPGGVVDRAGPATHRGFATAPLDTVDGMGTLGPAEYRPTAGGRAGRRGAAARPHSGHASPHGYGCRLADQLPLWTAEVMRMVPATSSRNEALRCFYNGVVWPNGPSPLDGPVRRSFATSPCRNDRGASSGRPLRTLSGTAAPAATALDPRERPAARVSRDLASG
jgi:hypothetical protein